MFSSLLFLCVSMTYIYERRMWIRALEYRHWEYSCILHFFFPVQYDCLSLRASCQQAFCTFQHLLCMSIWTQKARIHEHDQTMIMITSGVYNDFRNELMIF